MAFGIVHRFSGGTADQYENALRAVHPDGGQSLPEGQTLHIAGATDDGWIVIALFDSEESWERFRDDILMPGLPKVENGLQGPPQETTFEVHKQQSA